MRCDRLIVKIKCLTNNNKITQIHQNQSLWCPWCREDVPHGRSHLRAWRSGFLLPPRCLPASACSASVENSWRKSTPNKSPISGIAPGTFHCGANGALGVAMGASCCCEGVIVGHEKMRLCFRNTTERMWGLKSISMMTCKRILIHLWRIFEKCYWRVIHSMTTLHHLLGISFCFNRLPSSAYAPSFNTWLKNVKLLCWEFTLWLFPPFLFLLTLIFA